ncbi:glycosyl transferase [Tepiditoga spiralis]|uniref:Glycosyl transferase n=1 Tax=Tepiditoga spiralis TaxID=2108365 RepID=A0A7G1GA26_9BACT|nr:glycosyltransferase family 2 protein [Tepiditoga spiralis]BBE30229.1 glycosyl transferase [Tepiditoga spiralis]
MRNVLVSVITVSFNSIKTIKDTFESILLQNYKNIEYIVIDGKSNDGTVEIIESYKEKFMNKGISFKWVSEEDKGIYDAMNKGIKMAIGELIGIINSDDWYEKDIIEKIVNVYDKHNKPDIIHGNLKIYSERMIYKETRYPKDKYWKLWEGMIIKHPTCFIKKSLYEKIGLYNTKYKISSDYDFLLRAYINKARIVYFNNIISHMRLGGVSNEFLKDSWVEVERIAIKNGLSKIMAKYYFYKKILIRKIKKMVKKCALKY